VVTAQQRFRAAHPSRTGRGLEETKRRITEAFQQIRQHLPSPPLPPPQEPQVEAIYTEHHEAHFHAHAKSLIVAALSSSHMGKTPRGDVFEIVVPVESADELIAEAMRRFK
jgi:hypothetical protein